MRLPTLYKRTSKGQIEQWSIWVEEVDDESALAEGADPHNIITEYGHVGGKLQRAVETVYEGKNLGKANATTAKEQAESQARSEWTTKKARKGYTEDLAKAQAGENEGAGGIRPMLAHKYSDRGAKYAIFPGYVQAKLDGIRCVAVMKNGRASLWSREQKPIVGLPHIIEYLEKKFPGGNLVLDGEAYHHDYRSQFEEIASYVKQKTKPKDGYEVVQLHVYDLPSARCSFAERLENLEALHLDGPLVLVPTHQVDDEAALMEWFQKYLDEGYEGAMFRNAGSLYAEGKRSADLLKVKIMEDSEFEVIGVNEGVGKMQGLAIFKCVTAEGREFSVKMKGKLEELAKYLYDEKLWRGKQLTVQYQNLTTDGIPRFPVGIRLRDE